MNDTLRLQRALLAESKREGRPEFDPGPLDGNRGQKTRAALSAWAAWAHSQPHGLDVSSYQPAALIDWAAAKAGGVSFMVARASASLTPDAGYRTHSLQAHRAGVLTGAYHYFAPWRDPLKQAALFAGQWVAMPGDLPPVLDVEAVAPKAKDGQPAPIPCTSAELIERAAECLHEIERLTKRRPVFYSYSSFVREHNLAAFFSKVYKLWLADYREGPPTTPLEWPYAMHQYAGDTGHAPGVSGPCDLNRCKGNPADL